MLQNIGPNTEAGFGGSLNAQSGLRIGLQLKNVYRVECFDPAGRSKWVEEVPNIVVDVGANDLLTNYLKGSSYTAAFYVGLVDDSAFSAFANADTMSLHGGWTESVAFSNATRPALVLGTASSRSIDNSASKAVFNVNASATIHGAFVTTSSSKGGSSGILYGEAAFSTPRQVLDQDTLNTTVLLSA